LPVLTGTDMGGNITVEGGEKIPDEVNHVQTDAVSPGYFSTLGIPLVAGREFNAGDSTSAPKVAVINEALAKKYFGQRDPIGLHAGFGGGKITPDILIVGIVKNDKQDHVRSELAPFIFVPYSQRDLLYGMSFYVRTQQDPLLLAGEIRDGVRSIDPNLPVYDLKTFNRVVDEDLLAERLIAAMSAGFGMLAGLPIWSSSALAKSAFAWRSERPLMKSAPSFSKRSALWSLLVAQWGCRWPTLSPG
jgi:hypothetical protein